ASLGPYHAASQRARAQERSRARADGMEIFLHAVFTRRAAHGDRPAPRAMPLIHWQLSRPRQPARLLQISPAAWWRPAPCPRPPALAGSPASGVGGFGQDLTGTRRR